MRQFDDGREAQGAGDGVVVAQGPVAAAADARAAGANVGSPKNDENVPGEDGAGEAGEG